jgi:hypothetical protein
MSAMEFLAYIKEWYWVRAKFDDYTVVAASNVYRKHFGKRSYDIFYIAKGNEILVNNWSNISVSKRNKEIDPETGNSIYNDLIFNYQDERTKAKLSLKKKNSLTTYDNPKKMEQLKPNGFYHRLTGQGIFEIERDGKKETFESESIWEIVQVRK